MTSDREQERHADAEEVTIGRRALQVRPIGVAEARDQISTIMKDVAKGDVFLLRNERNAEAPAAFVISGESLERLLREDPVPETLADVLARLPIPLPLDVMPRAEMPDDVLPALTLPGMRG